MVIELEGEQGFYWPPQGFPAVKMIHEKGAGDVQVGHIGLGPAVLKAGQALEKLCGRDRRSAA